MDKRERAALFRQRLSETMAQDGVSRSALARRIGVDRSTVGQLLAEGETRLPNSQLTADAAQALGVSTDWLLGLTDRPERPGDLLATAVSFAVANRISVDEKLDEWHREAAGYKVRHVPASLPDPFKTEEMLRWEYTAHLGKTPDEAVRAMTVQMDWVRSGTSDYEIAVPQHEFESMASGTGYYAGLDAGIRRRQLDVFAETCDRLFPSVRLFVFDAREVFSAPVTVFGPILAVIYIGRFYLAFRASERVKSLTHHFDWLVREAKVDARDAAAYIGGLQVPD